MSRLVNGVLRPAAGDGSPGASITGIGLMMLGVALAGGAAAVTVSFLSTRIAAGIARDLRHAVFEKVESFSSREFDAFSTASLITRCTNDISQVQQIFVMGIRMICYAPIMGIGGIIMALSKAPAMSWIIVLAVILLVCMVMIVMSAAIPRFKRIQELVDKLNRIARETLNGLMVIRAFGTQDYEKKRFAAANQELSSLNFFVNRLMSVQMPGQQLIMNTAILLIIWIGTHRIAASTMEVGDMMAFIQYTMQIIFSFLFFSMMLIMIPRTAVSAERIAQVLACEVSIRDPVRAAGAAPEHAGTARAGSHTGNQVEFRGVYFHYEEDSGDVLEDINFTAERGETTAIIGATGAGKSSLVNLIMRFYDASRGAVLLDGVDVRELTQEELRSRIGYVPQKSILLSGSVSFNLEYGKRDASPEEIREAADIAQAMDFIGEESGAFDAALSQGGANVSGGQRQRLSIARALVRNPGLLIFDDSFSALDFATDARLRGALGEKRKGTTKIIVAQRVGTIMGAEKIIVLSRGRITGMGTHEQLMRTCDEYREIAESQLSGQEVKLHE
jgi:ATP-binding cassette subfamily B protein